MAIFNLTNMERPITKDYHIFNLYHYLEQDTSYNLENVVSEFTLDKNKCLYKPPTQHLFIYEVINGAIKLGSYTLDGKEFVYDVVSSNDFIGNLKYLNNQFFEFAKTLTSTRLRAYKLSFFKKVIIEEPRISEWFISYLVQRWCTAEKKLRKINEKSTTEKLRFLMAYLDKSIEDAEGNIHVLYDLLTQKDLGDFIGATRQTVATALKKNQSIFPKIPG
ncbi:CRP-like cAMP-binding protein [Flagellimonas meridianipacifica]|uniref:CRP-like cAMP-binding protein n=2 Tax=Flagellimonas meridianipacifica TaxID=1080225 RepID=A0A2T0MBS7_9FLAO|nr:CRP-like cAMP-binding protein [Allomuricauda pacifica]